MYHILIQEMAVNITFSLKETIKDKAEIQSSQPSVTNQYLGNSILCFVSPKHFLHLCVSIHSFVCTHVHPDIEVNIWFLPNLTFTSFLRQGLSPNLETQLQLGWFSVKHGISFIQHCTIVLGFKITSWCPWSGQVGDFLDMVNLMLEKSFGSSGSY